MEELIWLVPLVVGLLAIFFSMRAFSKRMVGSGESRGAAAMISQGQDSQDRRSVPDGAVVFEAPDETKLHQPAIVRAGVTSDIVKEIYEASVGEDSGDTRSASGAANVVLRLHGNPNALRISKESRESKRLYGWKPETAEWRWRVEPLKPGSHSLVLSIGGQLAGTNGPSKAVKFHPMAQRITIAGRSKGGAKLLKTWGIPLILLIWVAGIAALYHEKLKELLSGFLSAAGIK